MAKGGSRKGAGRPKGAITKRTREIAEKATLAGKTPIEILLEGMRFYYEAGNLDKACAIAKDAAPYLPASLPAASLVHRSKRKMLACQNWRAGSPLFLAQAAREKAEETPLAASGHQYGRQLADGEIA